MSLRIFKTVGRASRWRSSAGLCKQEIFDDCTSLERVIGRDKDGRERVTGSSINVRERERGGEVLFHRVLVRFFPINQPARPTRDLTIIILPESVRDPTLKRG